MISLGLNCVEPIRDDPGMHRQVPTSGAPVETTQNKTECGYVLVTWSIKDPLATLVTVA